MIVGNNNISAWCYFFFRVKEEREGESVFSFFLISSYPASDDHDPVFSLNVLAVKGLLEPQRLHLVKL